MFAEPTALSTRITVVPNLWSRLSTIRPVSLLPLLMLALVFNFFTQFVGLLNLQSPHRLVGK